MRSLLFAAVAALAFASASPALSVGIGGTGGAPAHSHSGGCGSCGREHIEAVRHCVKGKPCARPAHQLGAHGDDTPTESRRTGY